MQLIAPEGEELGDDALGEIKRVTRKVLSAVYHTSHENLVFQSFNFLSIDIHIENTIIMVIDSGRDGVAYHVPTPEEQPKMKQMPVTLLSGFLV
jgi:hypothetical protein